MGDHPETLLLLATFLHRSATSRMFQNIPECSTRFQNAYKIFQNDPYGLIKWLEDTSKDVIDEGGQNIIKSIIEKIVFQIKKRRGCCTIYRD